MKEIGLNSAAYGTHTLRRTKASLIYRRTKNLRAVQLLLGHSKLESTVRYRPTPALRLIEIELPKADIGKIPTACSNGSSQETDGVS